MTEKGREVIFIGCNRYVQPPNFAACFLAWLNQMHGNSEDQSGKAIASPDGAGLLRVVLTEISQIYSIPGIKQTERKK